MIFQSNAMTYGTTQIEMKMLWLLSRGTKGGRTEEISTETHGLTGSRIYSLTGPDQDIAKVGCYVLHVETLNCSVFMVRIVLCCQCNLQFYFADNEITSVNFYLFYQNFQGFSTVQNNLKYVKRFSIKG